MLRNITGPLLNFKNCAFVVVFGLLFKNPLLSARRTRFSKTKKQKKTKQLDHFLTLKRAKIGPLFNFTTYIYIYMLRCYYLGQVWPFEVLLSGPSLLFTKHCLSKTL